MAINEYSTFTQPTYQQDYVSQYVPLPFEQISAQGDLKQKAYDDSVGVVDDINTSIAKLEAIPGVDEEYKNQRLNEYNNKVTEIAENYGGDYGAAYGEIRGLANNLKKELSTGSLGRIHEKGLKFKQDMSAQDQLVAKGLRSQDWAEKIKTNKLTAYNQIGGEQSGTDWGIYNLNPTPKVQEKMQKFASQMKPVINTYLGLLNEENKLALEGYDTRSTTTKKELEREKIINALEQLAKSDTDIEMYKNIMSDAGLSSDEAINNLIEATGMQFEIEQTDRRLKDLREPTVQEAAARRNIDYMNTVLKSKAELYDAAKKGSELDQSDLIENKKQVETDFLNTIKDPKLKVAAKKALQTNNKDVFDSLIEKRMKGELSEEELGKSIEAIRNYEMANGQLKYEMKEFNKDPKNAHTTKQLKENLTALGIPKKDQELLIQNTESLGFFESVLIPDLLSYEDVPNEIKTGVVKSEATFNNVVSTLNSLDNKIKESIKNNADIPLTYMDIYNQLSEAGVEMKPKDIATAMLNPITAMSNVYSKLLDRSVKNAENIPVEVKDAIKNAKKEIKLSPQNSKIIKESLTNYREDIDDFAEKKNLRSSAYQPTIYGNPTAKDKTHIDKAIEYSSSFMDNHMNNLIDVENDTKASIFIANATEELLGKDDDRSGNTKIEKYLLPTTNYGEYQIILKGNNTGEVKKAYVKVDNDVAKTTLHDNMINSIKQQAVKADPAGQVELYNIISQLESAKMFNDIDKHTLNKVLEGNDVTHMWKHVTPTGGVNFFTFENIYDDNNNRTGVLVKDRVGNELARGGTTEDLFLNLYRKKQAKQLERTSGINNQSLINK